MNLKQRVKEMLGFVSHLTQAKTVCQHKEKQDILANDNKLTNKNQEGSSYMNQENNTFTIKYTDFSITLAIVSGFLLSIFFMWLLKVNGFQFVRKSILDSYIWTAPLNIIFFSLLIISIISFVFGKKNTEGVREFKRKYILLRSLLYMLFFLMLLMFGFMLGVYFRISTNLFF